jgi:predicted secreted hydrolase
MIQQLRSLKFRPSAKFQPLAVRLLSILAIACIVPLALAFQYEKALPGYHYHFPQDHASHPKFKTEWWYYTGHLKTPEGQNYGYELTFFRVGTDEKQMQPNNQSPWNTNNLYAAHFALSDEHNRKFYYHEKLNRAGMNVAGARTDTYYTWNELWMAEGLGNQMILRADAPNGQGEIHLLLTPEKEPVIHGKNGVSQKASCMGCASHYYSMTRLKTEGTLILGGKATPVTGLSWMDHEFGSNQLARNQKGWDWFSIQLNDNTELMLYLLRQDNGAIDPNSSGTWIDANGQSRHLSLKDFAVQNSGETWTSPASKGRYPMGWKVSVPSQNLTLTITPAFQNQELFTKGSTGVAYWEGSAQVSGARGGKSIGGQAYVEMTGYAIQSVKGKL